MEEIYIILEIKELEKKYSDFNLNKISFNIEEGDILGFIGPNGAGKSTTMKLILNLINKDGGSIEVFGKDNIKHEDFIKNKIGFAFDSNCFYEQLTLEEASDILSSFYSKWDKSLLKYYLYQFGLNPKKKIKELSKGMKMKFTIAIALCHDADFFLMDEATSGLDPFAREEILEILLEINKNKGKSFLFSSHIVSDIEKIANKIIFINDGNIILEGTKSEVLNKYMSISGDLKDFNEGIIENCIGHKKWKEHFSGLIKVEDEGIFRKTNYKIQEASLEDIIIYHTKGKDYGKTFKVV